jgi:uncharacterized protein YndB with AHSA1/START domain
MSTDSIEKRIILRASRARVWRAITDSKEFGAWFGVRFDQPFAPGAAMRGAIVPTEVDPAIAEKQKAYAGAAFEIKVESIEPERLFSFRWHPFAIEKDVDYSSEPTTLVSFTLEETKEGTILTIVESGFDGIPLARRARAFGANSDGWTMQSKLLEAYLAQRA